MNELYHCYRCGERGVETDDENRKCPSCKEPSLVTLTEALDMINNQYLMDRDDD
jgi:hypothetical protein